MSKKSGAESAASSTEEPRPLPEQRFHRLSDLSPSAKFVYKVLCDEGALTQDAITDRTLLPKRTVRYALAKLDQADLVEQRPCIRDARTQYYSPRPIERPDTE